MSKNRNYVEIYTADLYLQNAPRGYFVEIQWTSNIGFGSYSIYKQEDGTVSVDSECMDSNEDRWFLKLLLDKLNFDYITIDKESILKMTL